MTKVRNILSRGGITNNVVYGSIGNKMTVGTVISELTTLSNPPIESGFMLQEDGFYMLKHDVAYFFEGVTKLIKE